MSDVKVNLIWMKSIKREKQPIDYPAKAYRLFEKRYKAFSKKVPIHLERNAYPFYA